MIAFLKTTVRRNCSGRRAGTRLFCVLFSVKKPERHEAAKGVGNKIEPIATALAENVGLQYFKKAAVGYTDQTCKELTRASIGTFICQV